jgi:hypothetical protein
MSVLKLNRLYISAICVLILSGCGDESSAYRHIKQLPYSEWNSYATDLPLAERMSLHKEITKRSGHNPKMTIVSSFFNNPEETYKIIVDSVKSGDKGRYYLDIIYEINRNPAFDMCEKQDRMVVQRYLWSLATDAVRKENRPKFYSC